MISALGYLWSGFEPGPNANGLRLSRFKYSDSTEVTDPVSPFGSVACLG